MHGGSSHEGVAVGVGVWVGVPVTVGVWVTVAVLVAVPVAVAVGVFVPVGVTVGVEVGGGVSVAVAVWVAVAVAVAVAEGRTAIGTPKLPVLLNPICHITIFQAGTKGVTGWKITSNLTCSGWISSTEFQVSPSCGQPESGGGSSRGRNGRVGCSTKVPSPLLSASPGRKNPASKAKEANPELYSP